MSGPNSTQHSTLEIPYNAPQLPGAADVINGILFHIAPPLLHTVGVILGIHHHENLPRSRVAVDIVGRIPQPRNAVPPPDSTTIIVSIPPLPSPRAIVIILPSHFLVLDPTALYPSPLNPKSLTQSGSWILVSTPRCATARILRRFR